MILDLAASRAQLTPERPAVWADGVWHDYAQLNRRATALAARLYEAGVRAGDRVSIMASNHLAHIDAFLATAKLGFIYSPLNYRLSEPELRAMGDYLEPRLLLFDEANVDKAAAAGRDSALYSLTDYGDWLAGAGAAPQAPDLDPEDPQMILFTGGTSGSPKGALLPYRQIFFNAVNTVMSWGLRADDCVIQATPCFHAAFNAFTTPLLHVGARVVLQQSFEPGEYLRLLHGERATIMFLVPTMFGMLARHEEFARTDLGSVRWAISGGAPCTEAVRSHFAGRGVPFRQGYGLTEAGVNCFSIEQETADVKPGSVGKPMLHAEAVIRSEDGSEVAAGETGELTLRGRHVFSGYFRRPEATGEALRDGWLWTGDLARRDEDGDFFIAGRRKDMFISGGENIYPAEIENALSGHPAVAECAVIGVPDEGWGESGLAAVVLNDGSQVSDIELSEFLRGHLARYKVPKRFVFVDSLPKSAAGKVLGRELLSSVKEMQ